jgi:hypothetical protein
MLCPVLQHDQYSYRALTVSASYWLAFLLQCRPEDQLFAVSLGPNNRPIICYLITGYNLFSHAYEYFRYNCDSFTNTM